MEDETRAEMIGTLETILALLRNQEERVIGVISSPSTIPDVRGKALEEHRALVFQIRKKTEELKRLGNLQ
jgi:hypothetical protein